MREERPRRSDALRATVVLVMALGQIATTQASTLFGFAETVQSRSEAVEHALVPITFTIWAVIYIGALAFAIWQILPANLCNPVSRRIGWLVAGMYAVNTIWQIWAPWAGLDWVTFALLATSLGFGLVALRNLNSLGRPLSSAERLFAAIPLGILTGWLTAAAFVNFASSAAWAGAIPFDPQTFAVSVALLCGTILFAALSVNATRSWAQAGAIVWALHGIVVANLVREPQPVLAALAAAGIVIVIVARASSTLRPAAGKRVPGIV